jgi:hypothetical protein
MGGPYLSGCLVSPNFCTLANAKRVTTGVPIEDYSNLNVAEAVEQLKDLCR